MSKFSNMIKNSFLNVKLTFKEVIAFLSGNPLSSLPSHYDVITRFPTTKAHKPPKDIPAPSYTETKRVALLANIFEIHDNPAREAKLRESCRVLREVLNSVHPHIVPGITTDEIDTLVFKETIKRKAYPSYLMLMQNPKSCFTSVNNIVREGIPDSRPLKSGDIMSLSLAVYYNGYHSRLVVPIPIGYVDESALHLIRTARKATVAAIRECAHGARLQAMAHAVERTLVNERRVVLNTGEGGSGIGEQFDAPPRILFDINEDLNDELMYNKQSLAIGPSLFEYYDKISIKRTKYGNCLSTLNYARCAQCLHTVLVTERGVEVLTTAEPKVLLNYADGAKTLDLNPMYNRNKF